MRKADQKRVHSLQNAVRATVEKLEGRVLLAAGQLDWSYGVGAGYNSWAQTDVPSPYNPGNVPIESQDPGMWDGVLPENDRETIVHDAVVDSGGRLVVVGEQLGNHLYTVGGKNYAYYDRDFHVARYRKDGSLDWSSYNLATDNVYVDIATTPYPATSRTLLDDRAYAVVIEPQFLPDGVTPNPRADAIVVAGRKGPQVVPGFGMGSQLAIQRYSLSSSIFSRDLSVAIPGTGVFSITDMAIQAVGNSYMYLVTGSVWNPVTGQNFAMWRVDGTGALDQTFGTNGVVTTSFQSWSNDEITGVAVQPDGKIVVSGYADDRAWNDQVSGAHNRLIVGRYNADGTPDTGFGTGGFSEIEYQGGSNARGNGVMVQSNGRIVVVGTFDQYLSVTSPDGTPYDTGIIARLMPDGLLDQSFGTRGRLTINTVTPGMAWRAESVAEQSDGKLVIGGTQGDAMDIVRLSANGQLDLAYGFGDAHYLNPTPVIPPVLPGSETVPTGLRSTRTPNLEGDVDYTFAGYHYDTPVLVLGQGEDVDKAYIIGNFVSDPLPPVPVDPSLPPVVLLPGQLIPLPPVTIEEAGPYRIVRVQGDNNAPTAIVQAQDVELEQENATSYTFRVIYNDNVLIANETLDLDDVVVVGPDGVEMTPTSMFIVGFTAGIDANEGGAIDHRSYTVEYTITPPNGSWTAADYGQYTIRLRQDQVTDIEGVAVPTPLYDPAAQETYAELGNFFVRIFQPDVTAPTAYAPGLSNNMTVGGRTIYRFDVTFTEIDSNGNGVIDAGERVSVGTVTNDRVITVIGPNGYRQNARFIGPVLDPTDGQVRTATYEITAPGGTWDVTDMGTYFFNINANVVSDDYMSPNFAQASELGRMTVAIVAGQDVLPTATRVSADSGYPAASNQTQTTQTAKIVFLVKYEVSAYADPATVLDRDSIINNSLAVRVTSILPVFNSLAKYEGIVDSAPDDKWIVVEYSISPADNIWHNNDSGTYSVTLEPNQIADKNDPIYPASKIPSTSLGTITVTIANPIPAVTATLASVGSVVATAPAMTFSVTYSSANNLDLSTIVGNDNVIRVTGPKNFAGFATFVSVDNPSPGLSRTVTYRLAAPGGAWDFSDNGTYTIAIAQGNGVENIVGGKLAFAVLGTFAAASKSIVITGSTLTINGTDASDTIELMMLNGTDASPSNDIIQVIVNNVMSRYDRALVGSINITALGSNDTIKINAIVPAALIKGGAGNDTIWGGDGHDTIYGDDGDDYIVGGAGNDMIYGGNGNDRMAGTAGSDTIYGQAGNDILGGGKGRDRLLGGLGNDTITGGNGLDYLAGDAGDDWIYALDGQLDTIVGGTGYNRAQIDRSNVLDIRSGINLLLA